jgi:HAMP domain-containing protein
MNLRSRLLLGYGYLVVLLILGAAAAALGFHHLGRSIGRILDENFQSVDASMTMLHALERQDSALLASLLEEAGATRQIASSERDFQDALEAARRNVTIASERAILDDVEGRYDVFRRHRDELLDDVPDRPLQAYEAAAYPAFESVKESVLDLLEVNHRAMIEADRRARASAQVRALVHGGLVVIALVSLVVIARLLGRDLLDRLLELRAVARALASGDQTRRATVVRDDELGHVARQLNRLLDREAAIEGELASRLQALRWLVLGLLGVLDHPAAVISPSGDLLASGLADNVTPIVEEAAGRLAGSQSNGDGAELSVVVGSRTVRLRRLTATHGRLVGWLATVEEEAYSEA